MASVSMEVDQGDSASFQPHDFELLKLVTEERNTYGLRHQDFDKYRTHCARKVHYLRGAVGLTQGKGKKYLQKPVTAANTSHQRHLLIVLLEAERAWAHSRDIKLGMSRPPPPASKAAPGGAPCRYAARVKHRSNRRLIRAVSHASRLQTLLSHPGAPAAASAQGQVYRLYLEGLLAFERASYAEGLASLSVAYALLEDLARMASASAHGKALASEWVDQVTPLARFCAYKLEIPLANGEVGPLCQKTAAEGAGVKAVADYHTLRKGLQSARGAVAGEQEDVRVLWKGEPLEIRNVELAGLLLSVESAVAKLAALRSSSAAPAASSAKKAHYKPAKRGKGSAAVAVAVAAGAGSKASRFSKMAAYDAALLTLSDAEAAARRLVEDNALALSRAHSARFEAAAKPLARAHAYIAYRLLSTRIERDSLLASESLARLAKRETASAGARGPSDGAKAKGEEVAKKIEETVRGRRAKVWPGMVKLYDSIILSLESMLDLSLVEEEAELVSEVEGKAAYMRGKRCALQARAYDLAARYPESLLLAQRSALYIRQARSLLSGLDLPASDPGEPTYSRDSTQAFLPLSLAELDDLQRAVELEGGRTTTRWFDATGGRPGGDGGGLAPAADFAGLSLEEDRTAGAGAGAEAAESRRPPVFDVAYNYIAPPPLEALAVRAGLKAGQPPPPPAAAAGAVPMQVEQRPVGTGQAGAAEPPPPGSKRSSVWGFFSRG